MDSVQLAEVDRIWRSRVIAYGRRGFPGLSDEDLDEVYNSALWEFWRKGHDFPPREAGGMLCRMMGSRARDRWVWLRAERRDSWREEAFDAVPRGRAGRREGPLFSTVLDACKRLKGADLAVVRGLLAIMEDGGFDGGSVIRELAERGGCSEVAAGQRLSLLRRALVPECVGVRGLDGRPIDGRSHARGRTVAFLVDNRRKMAACVHKVPRSRKGRSAPGLTRPPARSFLPGLGS